VDSLRDLKQLNAGWRRVDVEANMKAKVFENAGQTLTVTALLLSVLLPVAVFVYGVLGTASMSKSGFSAAPNEQAVLADDNSAHGQW
jgi:hypothetical protein